MAVKPCVNPFAHEYRHGRCEWCGSPEPKRNCIYKCEKCGAPMPDGDRAVCARCRQEEYAIAQGARLGLIDLDDDGGESESSAAEDAEAQRRRDER